MLQARGLTRRFGDFTAVDDVTFDVAEGKMTGFVGANGTGKTTTMRMIMGILEPTSGEALWDGRPITRTDRARFGYMPEERGLYDKQPVIDQLIYLGELHGMTRSDARRSATEHLDRLGLGDRASDKLESLSLGNQQRVQVIAAVMAQPTALILDEPFSGLDPVAVESMIALLHEHTIRGVPILFSSHQLDLIDRLCDSLVILSNGAVVANGTPTELRTAGPTRYRLVTDGDTGWVRAHRGITSADVDRHTAIIDCADDVAQSLLSAALARGPVREFTPIVPTLSEIYSEVTA